MGNAAWNTPAQSNQVDIHSENPACPCCGDGFQFTQGQPVPPQLSPYLSQDEFNKGIAQANERTKSDTTWRCALFLFCLFVGGPVTCGIGFFICCCMMCHMQQEYEKGIETVALQGWKAQGLGVNFVGGKAAKENQAGHPARIRLTLPMNPQPAASMVGQPVAVQEQSSRTMQVTIPAGVAPGSQIQATAPDGTTIRCTVPEGAGSQMTVMY
jgi:hypothetical protein